MKSRRTVLLKEATLDGLPRCESCGLYFRLLTRGFICTLQRCPLAARREWRLISQGGLRFVQKINFEGRQRPAHWNLTSNVKFAPCRPSASLSLFFVSPI
jgi:hypothetical protein